MSRPAATETVPDFRRPASRGWAGRDAGDRFSICLERLFRHEGGFNNLKSDRGGATNFGISIRWLREEVAINPAARSALVGASLSFTPVTLDTIRNLTADVAARLYLTGFWLQARCDALPPGVDGMVFDQAVNAGRTAAIRLLQRAVNRAANSMPGAVRLSLLEDGQLGQRTLEAVERVPFLTLRRAFRAVTADRYLAIIMADPSQAVFRDGWLARAAALGDV